MLFIVTNSPNLQQCGWHNDEINARIERIEADSSGVEEDAGLYTTYAMLHTYRNEWVGEERLGTVYLYMSIWLY